MIRTFDWSETSLGPLDQWPVHVRSVVDLILHSRLPMAVLLGQDGLLIYNDAYALVCGSRHPGILGGPVVDGWPEAADFNSNVLNVVLAGGTLSYVDQHMVLHRSGAPEDVWFNLDYSPIIGDGNQPIGVLAVVIETTERARAEQRLRMAQQSGGVGTFEWYPDTGRMDVSDEFRRIWGLADGVPVTDRMLIEMMDPRDVALSGPSRFNRSNPLEYAEYRIRRADDGKTRWIARRGEAITAPDGGHRRFLGVAIDITDRKAAEEAVRTSEARWRGLFEQMQEGFVVGELIRDPLDGTATDFRFLEVNPAFEVQTGLSWRDMIGRTIKQAIPGIASLLVARYAELVETKKPSQFEIQISELGERWFDARARPTEGDRFAILFVDITARKKIEAELLDSEARFRSLAQSVPNHVWAAAPDGRLEWFNEQVLAYAGVHRENLVDHGWSCLLHPDDQETAISAWMKAIASRTPYQTEFRIRRHDGVYRWHIARAVPIQSDDGDVRRWIGTNTDIEDQKAAAQALATLADILEQRVAERTNELVQVHEALRQSQKMEAVGQLTGGIAHDFNNLLQGIVGSLDVVQKRVDQGRVDDVQRFLNGAMASAHRAAALTHRLLAFSRRQPLDPKPVKVNPLLASMDELLRRTIGEAIELEFVLAGGLWQTRCDVNQLESALLNLVINARDAMPDGGKLTIESCNAHLDSAYTARARDVEPGQYVCIAVTDTGTGMSPEVIERAFDPFFTTKPIGKGTGLGLSMIYGFTRQSEGYSRIYSEVGRGTTVKLYLPRYREQDDEPELPLPVDEVHLAADDETVLVVEDDSIVRGLVIEVLKEMGYQPYEASDGPAGVQLLESIRRIDLLITDIGLPGLNGRQVAEVGRKTHPNLKVLYMTGYAENAALANGFLEPGMAMITKPFSMDTLTARIKAMLQPGG